MCSLEKWGDVASFPGSPCARTKNGKERFSVLQATESWAGPGNEARVDAVLIIVRKYY